MDKKTKGNEPVRMTNSHCKKKHHIRANMGLAIRIGLTVIVLTVAYLEWPKLHDSCYQTFWLMLYYLSDIEVWMVAANNVRIGLATYPVTSIIELAVITVTVWKFIRNGYIVALFRLKVIAMVVLSGIVVWFLYFKLLGIQEFGFYIRYIEDILFARSSLKILLYPIGYDNALFVYSMLIIYLVGYLVVKAGMIIMYWKDPRDRLSADELEELGIAEVIMAVNPIRRTILPRPRFYVDSTEGDGAHCEGRNIVIGTGIINNGIETIQGVVAHELGHYYHYDIAANMVTTIAVGAILLALNLGALVAQIVGIFFSLIPGFITSIVVSFASLIVAMAMKVGTVITYLITLAFWLIDGKWAERAADIFAVNIGFGEGLYLYLFDIDKRNPPFRLADLIDVHPLTPSRLRYVRRRIKTVWGNDTWEDVEHKAREISEAYRAELRDAILRKRQDRFEAGGGDDRPNRKCNCVV